MDYLEVPTREKSRAVLGAVALALVVSMLAPSAVMAAVQKVSGTVTAKLKDTGGDTINASAIPAQGLTDVPGSTGAVDVRNFAGGAGLLGVAGCAGTGLPSSIDVNGGAVVTDLLMTGTDGAVSLTSTAVAGGQVSLLNVTVSANAPNVIADLSSGLGVTAPLKFTVSGTNCNLVILGHGAIDA